jgi:hypothetical protein
VRHTYPLLEKSATGSPLGREASKCFILRVVESAQQYALLPEMSTIVLARYYIAASQPAPSASCRVRRKGSRLELERGIRHKVTVIVLSALCPLLVSHLQRLKVASSRTSEDCGVRAAASTRQRPLLYREPFPSEIHARSPLPSKKARPTFRLQEFRNLAKVDGSDGPTVILILGSWASAVTGNSGSVAT